ncbi:MAG TPA: hypothetical protein VIK95_14010 [Egibacteraceae bacterium]
MRRYLVVANLTVAGEPLLQTVRELMAQGPCRFTVVVPAGADPASWHAHDEAHDVAAARARLDAALEAFRAVGADVEGRIGDPRPVDAVRDVLREGDYDEIIVSTLPPGVSRWLRTDVVRRIERAVDLPVRHVYGVRAPAVTG